MQGCDKFLSENPSRSTSVPITHCDQLDALLENYGNYYSCDNMTAIYGTDDTGLTIEMYDRIPTRWSSDNLNFVLWDSGDNIPLMKRYSTWITEYAKIFRANVVFQYVDQVPGTEEQKIRLKGEAHLIRAYSMMEIVGVHCLPYTEATKGEPGIPLKKTTSFEETDTRATLEETHNMIESDLEEALRLTNALVVDGRVKHWRGNKAAANAVAARYWLSRNDYEKALGYAETALSIYSDLIDYNTEMRYSLNSVEVKHYPDSPDVAETFTVNFPYGYDNQSDMTDMLGWKEFYYFRLLNNAYWWYSPSEELISTYDTENDLRYKYHMVEGFSYISPVGATGYPSLKWWGYINFFKDRHVHGPTTAEMILTKAECQARAGNFNEAMNTVNTLRKARMSDAAPAEAVNLTATSRQDAVEKILAERRREMPMAMRWFDARRLNNNSDAFDDIEFVREFYPRNNTGAVLTGENPITYKLGKNSRRWAVPIPYDDIVSSKGNIEQNKYDN